MPAALEASSSVNEDAWPGVGSDHVTWKSVFTAVLKIFQMPGGGGDLQSSTPQGLAGPQLPLMTLLLC